MTCEITCLPLNVFKVPPALKSKSYRNTWAAFLQLCFPSIPRAKRRHLLSSSSPYLQGEKPGPCEAHHTVLFQFTQGPQVARVSLPVSISATLFFPISLPLPLLLLFSGMVVHYTTIYLIGGKFVQQRAQKDAFARLACLNCYYCPNRALVFVPANSSPPHLLWSEPLRRLIGQASSYVY